MEGVIGYITLFAGPFAPANWAYCNGQIMKISQYPALFQILSNKYGGDGIATFALPNLQGRAAISAGQGPDLANYTLGQSGGNEVCYMGTNSMPAHTHGLSVQLTPGTNTTANTASPQNAVYATSANALYNYSGDTPMQTYNGTLTIGSTGYHQPDTPQAPIPCLHPVLGVNYVICLNGNMP